VQHAWLQHADELVRPFFKWAGGKRQLLRELERRVPERFASYFEPFVGSGALFFALKPRHAVLADANERLIPTYQGVRDDIEGVINLLKKYPYDPAFFHRLRQIDIDRRSHTELAAWFIYLNKGSCRLERCGALGYSSFFGPSLYPRGRYFGLTP
jgi:DNA adenine methylase